jgi:hypothetical protein
VTVIGPDGEPLPGAVVTFGDYDGVIEIGGIAHYAHKLRMRGWWRCPRCNPRGNPPKLPVDGREYARRQAARKRR